MDNVLSSQWPGLSQHLIATFWRVDRLGNAFKVDKSGNPVNTGGNLVFVKAPLSESNIDISLGWVSPFESAGAEKSFPTILAMLESGESQPLIDGVMKSVSGLNSQTINNILVDLKHAAKNVEGKTGVTKLNSMQVFTGMPPLKFSLTAMFRALEDPIKEVEDPVNQLMSWALPQQLAADATLFIGLINSVADIARGTATVNSVINNLLPSTSPVLLAMQYKNRTFSPLVIESINYPLSSPIDANGNFVDFPVNMNICSLAAWDRSDWQNSKRSLTTG